MTKAELYPIYKALQDIFDPVCKIRHTKLTMCDCERKLERLERLRRLHEQKN